jgi:hypothetical protein
MTFQGRRTEILRDGSGLVGLSYQFSDKASWSVKVEFTYSHVAEVAKTFADPSLTPSRFWHTCTA